jgi:mannose-1-phosphate guanylyltransferase
MNVILESEPRDSAAAIGLAAAILHRREPDVIIGSFAADHVIRVLPVFHWAVEQAVAVARQGYICTIGITPTEPSVGFGYIKKGDMLAIEGAPEGALVERFVEKPDLETAKSTWHPATTCGTRACSSRAPMCCSPRSRRTTRSCTPA